MVPSLLIFSFLTSLPPEAGELLGFEPGRDPSFITLYERKIPPKKEAPWTVQKVELANCGGNRFLFGVHFLETYPAQNAVLILYVDSDQNVKTGRKDHGCEFMLTLYNGQPSVTAFAPDGTRISGQRPRSLVRDQSAWISYDLDFPQQENQSLIRLAVLSEKSNPHVGVDHLPYRIYRGPPASSLPKVALPESYKKSRGFGRIIGLRRIEQILARQGVVRIPAPGGELQGFRRDRSEYRRENATCSGPGAQLRFTVPVEGEFCLGAVVQDGRGKDIFKVKAGGKTLGYIAGIWDDQKQHLFFSREKIRLKSGDPVTLESLGDGRHRTEELVLLPERPEETEFPWEFREISSFQDSVCFITTWPALCEMEIRGSAGFREEMTSENHRLRIPGASEGKKFFFRLKAQTPEGDEIKTGWLEHLWPVPEDRLQKNSGEVALKVTPPAGLILEGWPVSSGVPFPQGELTREENVTLHSGETELPLQTRISARWPDGSIKWLLCDFRHLGGEGSYALRYGPERKRDIKKVAGKVPEIGHLSLLRGDGKSFRGILNLSPKDGGELRQLFSGGGTFKARDGERFFHHEIRVHRFPGLPYARALITFAADETYPEFSEVRSLSWHLPAAGRRHSSDPIQVRQTRDDMYETSMGETGKRWEKALGPVFIHQFWQNYPKGIRLETGETVVELLPPLQPDQYTWARGTLDEHRLFFWFSNGAYRIRQGMAKTHEIWLGLDGSPPLYDRLLLAVCEPIWYVHSKAFGSLPPASTTSPILRRYDLKFEECFQRYLQNREKNREYGLFNFGDWWGERVINWGNVEYDTQHALFLQFVRTGDLRYFHAAEEAEIHNRDIDTVLRHKDPRRIGTVAAHSIGHVGDYYKTSPHQGRGSPRAYLSVSHTWCEGHLDHYFLTGDMRSLEAARKIADHFNTYDLNGFDFTNTRIPGWHLILTMALYRASGDPFYRNGARIIVERVLERQTLSPRHGRPPGGWVRMMVPGHCHCEPFHYGNAGFMVGVLLTGLKWYHLETDDQRVARAIVRGARFLIDDLWIPEKTGFRYTSCPRSSTGVWSNLLLADGLAYAYQISKDEQIAEVIRKAIPAGIEGLSGFGKSFGQATRVAPHALSRCLDLLK